MVISEQIMLTKDNMHLMESRYLLQDSLTWTSL